MANYVQQTWTDGSSALSAARMGVIEQGIYDAHFQPAGQALRATTQIIPNASWTQILFDSENFDTDGIHDTVSNTGRLTCQTAGKYLWSFRVELDSGTSGARFLQVQRNNESLPGTVGAVWGGVYQDAPSVAVSMVLSTAGCVDLAANDYLALLAYQSAGTAITVGAGSHFGMVRVA